MSLELPEEVEEATRILLSYGMFLFLSKKNEVMIILIIVIIIIIMSI